MDWCNGVLNSLPALDLGGTSRSIDLICACGKSSTAHAIEAAANEPCGHELKEQDDLAGFVEDDPAFPGHAAIWHCPIGQQHGFPVRGSVLCSACSVGNTGQNKETSSQLTARF